MSNLSVQLHNNKRNKKSTILQQTQQKKNIINLTDEIRLKRPQSRQFIYMPNVQFYLNKMSSSPNGTFIDLMHKHWWGNYILLQTNHSYIQWLFPNSFQSRFNQNAKPLTKQQCKIFRQNLQIARRYVLSYQMILQFFGMKLRNRLTGQICRTLVPNFKDRYDQTLLSAYHNHLRITRILCSLTQVGFSYYARQLCKFLKKQIYQHNGRLIRLKHMDVYKHWRKYQQNQKKRSDTVDIEDIPSIYLRQLWKIQGFKPFIKQRSKWAEIKHKNKSTIVLQDQSDQEKQQVKINVKKNQQIKQSKQQQQSLNNDSKLNNNVKKLQNNNRKQQYNSKLQNKTELSNINNSQFSDSQQQYKQQDEKYRKSHIRSTLDNQRLHYEQRLIRTIRRQQLHQKKLQASIQQKLLQDNDNYVKRQMAEIRQKFNKKLQQFKKIGMKKAQTIQQRQIRMMGKGHRYTIQNLQDFEGDEESQDLQ